jgi:hypothetical protein
LVGELGGELHSIHRDCSSWEWGSSSDISSSSSSSRAAGEERAGEGRGRESLPYPE